MLLILYLKEPIETDRVLYIPKGSVNKIITHMQNLDMDINRFDSYILRFLGTPQSGWIDLKSDNLSKLDFLYALVSSKSAMHTITLIPGESNYLFIDKLAKEFNFSKSKLYRSYQKYSPYEDGVILANSYSIPYGISEDALMKFLIHKSLKRHIELSKEYFREFNLKEWFRYVTIASIIQKEAGKIEEFKLISAVIHNRLKKKMKLQMDGSLNYGEFSNRVVSASRIDSDTSQFNTYKQRGLPPHPICAVLEEAIEAALNPADVDYLFFVKKDKSSHIFSKTYREHLKNIKRY